MRVNKRTRNGSRGDESAPSTHTRRAALKTIAAAGIGFASAGVVPTVRAAEKTTTITEAMVASSDSPDTDYSRLERDVPTDWYEALKNARAVHDREKFYERLGVVGSMVRPGSFDGEEPSIQVDVETSEEKTAATDSVSTSQASSIPNSIDGVQIDVVEVDETSKSQESESVTIASGCGQSNYGDTPSAGVKCSADTTGTLGTPLVDNGQMYFATAYHLFGSSPVSNNGKLYQSSSTAIGEVVDGDCTADFVACDGINGHSPTRQIHGTSYKSWGHYTKNGVQALAADNEPVTKQGISSCETSGQIGGVGVYIGSVGNGCGNRSEQIRWGTSSDIQANDSGSVAYHHHKDDKVLIVALNTGATSALDPRGNFSFGTGAYHIHDEFGYGW